MGVITGSFETNLADQTSLFTIAQTSTGFSKVEVVRYCIRRLWLGLTLPTALIYYTLCASSNCGLLVGRVSQQYRAQVNEQPTQYTTHPHLVVESFPTYTAS